MHFKKNRPYYRDGQRFNRPREEVIRTLLLVRHPKYKDNGELTEEGSRQITDLSQRIFNQFPGKKPKIISSDSTRTKNTARIIANKFRVDFQIDTNFGAEKEFIDQDLINKVLEHQNNTELLIIISHSPIIKNLLTNYPKIVWNDSTLESIEIPLGSLLSFDDIKKVRYLWR